MRDPLVSVIVPCYNHRSYVEAAIRSVIAQSYSNIELIVLDDGSVDDSVDVIRRLEAECRTRFVRYEFVAKQNEGVAATMNRGIAWARGDYVSSVSSDDEMMPEKISTLLQLFRDAPVDCAMACGDAGFMDNDGREVSLSASGAPVAYENGWKSFIPFYLRERSDVKPDKNFFSYETLIKGNYVPGMAMIWGREALVSVGCFTPGVAIEDWDLWLKLAREFSCVHTPEIVARYRVHGANTSVTAINKMRLGIDFILEREFDYVRSKRRSLAPGVARMWLRNSRKLYKAGHRRYFGRFFQLEILLAAIGLVFPVGARGKTAVRK